MTLSSKGADTIVTFTQANTTFIGDFECCDRCGEVGVANPPQFSHDRETHSHGIHTRRTYCRLKELVLPQVSAGLVMPSTLLLVID